MAQVTEEYFYAQFNEQRPGVWEYVGWLRGAPDSLKWVRANIGDQDRYCNPDYRIVKVTGYDSPENHPYDFYKNQNGEGANLTVDEKWFEQFEWTTTREWADTGVLSSGDEDARYSRGYADGIALLDPSAAYDLDPIYKMGYDDGEGDYDLL